MMTLKKNLALAAVALACTLPAIAQGPAPATVHGKVTYASGSPLPAGATVELTKDKYLPMADQKMKYVFQLDANGMYKGADIAPGDYLLYVNSKGAHIDRLEVTFKPGEDKTVDDDMTRADYLAAMKPEDRKALEEYKKANAIATKDNEVINNLNAALADVRADMKTPTPNFDKDIATMKTATEQRPTEDVLWYEYGNVLVSSARAKMDADKKAHTPVTQDADAMQQLNDGAAALQKSIDLNVASKKPNPAIQASAYNMIGSSYGATGKVEEAKSAYENAARIEPANAFVYFNNEGINFYQASLTNSAMQKPALDAFNKALAVNPNKPETVYLKIQVLLADPSNTIDPKTQMMKVPPGTVDALQTYLQLAPTGPHAADVTAILQSLGEKVDTHYKAKR